MEKQKSSNNKCDLRLNSKLFCKTEQSRAEIPSSSFSRNFRFLLKKLFFNNQYYLGKIMVLSAESKR